ncbi:biotin transport system substrate-specific component [Clostridium acidisoli DSM 12555]|uniref:Biotin transporter n=1 Tax=Clostridium acidisoli DSM 12555 TaxID=1121291 RepID=A0A1W1WY91_9CLOT|nr:biotin transporter BioY [Clostridium acidisoli]SMC16696.1 biotin transport system substrate-specific component [Clostridium acidisoli DSM 12555]
MTNTRNLILVALFAALTALGAFIRVPIPYVPFTLQYLFCALAGMILGSRLGALSQLVYVSIGLMGVPVFTEGGGIYYIFKPTFGYLIGFIVAAYVIGKIRENIKELNLFKSILTLLSGLFFIYLFGVIYLYFCSNLFLGQKISLYFAFFYGFLVCISGDILITIFTAYISVKILPILKKSGYI